jgi:hypothetical protein
VRARTPSHRQARRRRQSGKTDKGSGFDGQPATILGGALKDLASANVVAPASNIAPSNQSLLNLLA